MKRRTKFEQASATAADDAEGPLIPETEAGITAAHLPPSPSIYAVRDAAEIARELAYERQKVWLEKACVAAGYKIRLNPPA